MFVRNDPNVLLSHPWVALYLWYGECSALARAVEYPGVTQSYQRRGQRVAGGYSSSASGFRTPWYTRVWSVEHHPRKALQHLNAPKYLESDMIIAFGVPVLVW